MRSIYIVVSSINELSNLLKFKSQFLSFRDKAEIKVIIVDEGDNNLRNRNRKILQDLQCDFFGPKERALWFQKRFGKKHDVYLSVIPQKCHAEISFGFLVAYEENADIVIELDDDVYPEQDYNLISSHIDNLLCNDGIELQSSYKWYNTLENLILNYRNTEILFPRGHPYSQETRMREYKWIEKSGKCVLNMGLWSGHPDLDALTILFHGGLDGKCNIISLNLKREKIIIGKGIYFALCSMNTSFISKIIPAFYQLYMNYMGVNRFDDIWSGIFIKKIADHLGDKICIGKPLIYHNKRPRNIFKDLRYELEGMAINEILWKIVDSLELNGKNYYDCYQELINGLRNNLNKFNDKFHRDFIKLQIQKMRIWLDIIDRLS